MLGKLIILFNDCNELTFLVLSRIVSTFQIKTISKVIIIFFAIFRIISIPSFFKNGYHPEIEYSFQVNSKGAGGDWENGEDNFNKKNSLLHCMNDLFLRAIWGYYVRLRNSNEVYFLPSCLMCTNIPNRIILLLLSPSTLDKYFHDPYLHVYATFLKYHTNVESKIKSYQTREYSFKIIVHFFIFSEF